MLRLQLNMAANQEAKADTPQSALEKSQNADDGPLVTETSSQAANGHLDKGERHTSVLIESETTPAIVHVNRTGCPVQTPPIGTDLDHLLVAVATNPDVQRALVLLHDTTPGEKNGTRTPSFSAKDVHLPAVEITIPEDKPTVQSIVDNMKKANGSVEEKEEGSSEVIDASPVSEDLEDARAEAPGSEKKLTPVEEEELDDTDGELEAQNVTSNPDGEITAR